MLWALSTLVSLQEASRSQSTRRTEVRIRQQANTLSLWNKTDFHYVFITCQQVITLTLTLKSASSKHGTEYADKAEFIKNKVLMK